MYGRPCINVKVEPCSTKCMIYWQCSSFVVTGNLNCLFAYDQDTCSVQQTTSIDRECSCFCSKHESDKPVPRVLSQICMNVQLRQPSATTNYVVFISGSEFGSEQQSQSLSTQSEQVTHLHMETYHKNPLDTLWVSMC